MKKFFNFIIIFLSAAVVVITAFGLNSYKAYAEELTDNGFEENAETKVTVPETKEQDHPAFERSVNVEGVNVSLEADEDVFPDDAWLSVERVTGDEQGKIDEAVGKARDEGVNTAVSYTYDIKVFNKENEEIQPANDKSVRVSFATDEVANKNLDTKIYHVEGEQDLSATELDVKTDGNVAAAVTGGFSYYTVEFTYDDKEFVLEGGDSVKLSDLLESIGITGEVSSYEISNTELFNIFLGDEEGIDYDYTYEDEMEIEIPKNKENGTIKYMVALQAFDTEEWLEVTIDGVSYTIVVTDAQRVDEDGNSIDSAVKYLSVDNSNPVVPSVQSITDGRVIQGPTEDNFTASMPLAEIYIDDTIVDMDLWHKDTYNGTRVIAEMLVDTTDNKYKGFVLNTDTNAVSPKKDDGVTYYIGGLKNSYGGLVYDFSKRVLNYDPESTNTTLTVGTNENNKTNWEKFDGPIVKYTLKGMARKFDVKSNTWKNYDVVLTYSDILLTICNQSNTNNVDQSTLVTNKAYITLMDSNAVNICVQNADTIRAGMSYTVNVQVVDPDDIDENTGEPKPVEGSYYYPMVDIDVGRTGVGNFRGLYQAAQYKHYSEQIALLDNYGRPTSSGDWEQMIWIPGGNWSGNPKTNKSQITNNNHPYTCKISSETIDGQSQTLLIQPGRANGGVTSYIGKGDGSFEQKENSFYSGFITLANNTNGGIKVRGWNSALGTGGMESYVLTGSKPVNHKLDASSDEGGTIYTTTTGNADGTLSGGALVGNSDVNTPHEISVATGQSVTYTMTPKGGYKIKNVYVKNEDIDILAIVTNAKNTVNRDSFDSNQDGELDETEQANYDTAVNNAVNTALSSVPDNKARKIPISDLTKKDHGIYTYTFEGINEDNSIHVEWEKTQTTVTKVIDPSESGVQDKFKFQIKLTDTSSQETTWRVRAKKNNFVFRQDNSIAEETPYYMSYYESHYETGEIVTYTPVDTTEYDNYPDGINPSELEWYEEETSGGVTRYVRSPDTEVTDVDKIYYTKDTKQGNIPRYFHHILGDYDESTRLWAKRDVKSDFSHETAADLGTDNLDNELGDNYRFVQKDGKVYIKSSYDEENDTYTEYLMWVHDDDIDEDILVVGNEEMQTQLGGTPFVGGTGISYVYIWEDNMEHFSGKVIYTAGSFYGHEPNASENKYKCEKDENSAVYYDFVNNPDNYQIGSGYSKLEGESGMYIITLPAGENPETEHSDGFTALKNDGWDVSYSQVGAVPDDFDMDKAFTDKGATKVDGATNTYEFELDEGETIDFEGCVPMGWNYEITEITPPGWELKSSTANATISDYGGEEDVTFTNARIFDLTVEKNVTGNMGSKEKYFKFDITLTAPADRILNLNTDNLSKFDGGGAEKPNDSTIYTRREINTANSRDDDSDPANGQQIIMPSGGGNVTFSVYMKNDQKITISNLPAGASYSISEECEDYLLSADLSHGEDRNKNDNFTTEGDVISLSGKTVADNYLKDDAYVLLINNMDTIVPTGTESFPWYWVVVTGVLAGGVVIYLIKRRKEREDKTA